MKDTVLSLTQDILSSLDAAEVDSIHDTAESQQVARLIRRAYYNIASRLDLPENEGLFNLVSSADKTKPVLMYRPSNVVTLEWIKYNTIRANETSPRFLTLKWLPIDEFLDRQNMLTQGEVSVAQMSLSVNGSHVSIPYRTDRAPEFYASFDDSTILFNAFDNEVDDTLQSSKTECFGVFTNEFSLTDSFVPPLNDAQFALLFNEAKALAFAELKQTAHLKAEGEAKRQWTALQRNKRQINGRTQDFDRLPDYGRK